MAFKIEIPLEMLADERVTSAIANLTQAVGDAKAGRRSKTIPPGSPTMSWESFMEGTTPATRDFLEAVRDSGKLSITEAVQKLGLDSAQPNKAMGGLTGAFSRKVTRNGFRVPYKQVKSRKGERVWVWDQSVWDQNVAHSSTNGVRP